MPRIVLLAFIRPDRIEHTSHLRSPSSRGVRLLPIILGGPMRKALLVKPGKVVDQFPDEFLELQSNSVAEERELKTHQLLRSKCSHFSSYTEGHLVDAEDQLHDLVHDKRQRPLQLHQASADTQIHDLGGNGLITRGQSLDACKARTLKTWSAPKFFACLRYLLWLWFLGRLQFFARLEFIALLYFLAHLYQPNLARALLRSLRRLCRSQVIMGRTASSFGGSCCPPVFGVGCCTIGIRA